MLVLSRKINEQIVVNDNIVVTIVDIRGDKVRLGVDAPREIPVHRKEVWDAIRAQGARELKGERREENEANTIERQP